MHDFPQKKSVFLRPLPHAGFLSSDWFMRLWEGQPFSFANFNIVIITSQFVFSFYLFSSANISPVRFALTFSGLMMRLKMQNKFPCQ